MTQEDPTRTATRPALSLKLAHDLFPAASFIAYNTPVDVIEFQVEATRILRKSRPNARMYETTGPGEQAKGKINYTSLVRCCMSSDCIARSVFWTLPAFLSTAASPEYDLCAVGAYENIGPDCVVYLSFGFALRVGRFVHPAGIRPPTSLVCGWPLLEFDHIHGGVVVPCRR